MKRHSNICLITFDYFFDYPQKKKRRKPGTIKASRHCQNGDSETRTRDLYVANVSLSQLSYIPTKLILDKRSE